MNDSAEHQECPKNEVYRQIQVGKCNSCVAEEKKKEKKPKEKKKKCAAIVCRGYPRRYNCGHPALNRYVVCDYWFQKQGHEGFQGGCHNCPDCIEDEGNPLIYEDDCGKCQRKRAKKLRRLVKVLAKYEKSQTKFMRRWEDKKAKWARDPVKARKPVPPPSPDVSDTLKTVFEKLARLVIEPMRAPVDLVRRAQERRAAQQAAVDEAYTAYRGRQIDEFLQGKTPSPPRNQLELSFKLRDEKDAESR
ncbi:hypothetical protein DL95DRAFT_464681 [Leptodontidium sp. 2 PMI_412]|nr:hypothetical protein DL95DRAFT_464681 [Leptodontidium sp. 2 PMI_412]